MVVDDRRDNEYLLKALIKKCWDVRTRSTSDGPSGIRLLDEWTSDVILLDLGSPGMSSLELVREIRKRKEGETYLIVALTGYDDEDTHCQAFEAGVDLYRPKPASITMIQEIFCHPELATTCELHREHCDLLGVHTNVCPQQ